MRPLLPLGVLTVAAVVAACTPPLPPDVLAANAERQIECQAADAAVTAPGRLADAVAQFNTSLQGLCPEQSMTATAPGEPAAVTLIDHPPTAAEVADAAAACPSGSSLLVAPTFGVGIAVAFNIIGIDTLTLTPAVIAGILQGSITSWDDPAIAALNDGIDLTGLPITLVRPADASGAVQAISQWLSQTAPEAWSQGTVDVLPAGEPMASGQELVDALFAADGAVTVMSIAEASRNVFGMASIPIPIPDTSEEVLMPPSNADLVKIGIAAAQVTTDEQGHMFASHALGGVPVAGQFDQSAAKIVLQPGQPTIGWPVIEMVHVLACDDPADPLPRLTAQFMNKLAGQGVLDGVGFTPLPEPVRVLTFPALNVTVPTDAPVVPEPTS